MRRIELRRGDIVLVTLYGGDKVERRVWEPTEFGATICRLEAYEEALRSGEEPVSVGFRREFIEGVV